MRLIRIGIGCVDTTVGAVQTQTDELIRRALAMGDAGLTLGCFPEQVIGGYPAEDLVQWQTYVGAQRRALERIARATEDLPTVCVLGLITAVGGHLYNTAADVDRLLDVLSS